MKRIFQLLVVVLAMTAASLPTPAEAGSHGFKTSDPALITLNVDGEVTPIISVGEFVDGVRFEGLPDGIGIVPSEGHAGSVDVYEAEHPGCSVVSRKRDALAVG